MRDGIGINTYLHDPMDHPDKLKLNFWVEDLGYHKGGIPAVGWRRQKMPIIAAVADP